MSPDVIVRSYDPVRPGSISCVTRRSPTQRRRDARGTDAGSLNEEGIAQATAVAEALRGIVLDPRPHERPSTAPSRRRRSSHRAFPPSRGPSSARSRVAAVRDPAERPAPGVRTRVRGVIPNDADSSAASRSASSSTASSPGPSAPRHGGDDWDTARGAPRGVNGDPVVRAHRRADVPRPFEQAPACVNVLDLGGGDEWIVRRGVNVAPYDLLHLSHRQTTMERYWDQYEAGWNRAVTRPLFSHTQGEAWWVRPVVSDARPKEIRRSVGSPSSSSPRRPSMSRPAASSPDACTG